MMRLLRFFKENYSNLLSMFIFGGTSLYCFIKGNNILGTISLFFVIIVYLLMEIQGLSNRVGELELKLCDLDIKIGKVKWGIKD